MRNWPPCGASSVSRYASSWANAGEAARASATAIAEPVSERFMSVSFVRTSVAFGTSRIEKPLQRLLAPSPEHHRREHGVEHRRADQSAEDDHRDRVQH